MQNTYANKLTAPHQSQGFTIVELLIVIVVIAVLAVISIVTYTGISNRAYDSVVKNDLSGMARKIQIAQVETGIYPAGGRQTNTEGVESGNSVLFPDFTFSLSRASYGSTVPTSLGYCTDGQNFRIMARSKSGRFLEYSSMSGLVDLGTSWRSIYAHLGLCDGFAHPYSFAYANVSSTTDITAWNAWTN